MGTGKDQNTKKMSEIRNGFKFHRLTPSSHREILNLSCQAKKTSFSTQTSIPTHSRAVLAVPGDGGRSPGREPGPENLYTAPEKTQPAMFRHLYLQDYWELRGKSSIWVHLHSLNFRFRASELYIQQVK